jgi:hypothetical protein
LLVSVLYANRAGPPLALLNPNATRRGDGAKRAIHFGPLAAVATTYGAGAVALSSISHATV